MHFTNAAKLVEEINKHIAVHGTDLEIAFGLDDAQVASLKGAVGGGIKIESIEGHNPPVLFLTFDDGISNDEVREFIDEYWASEDVSA